MRKKLKLQRLSFNDYNEEKSGLLSPITPEFDIIAMKEDPDYQTAKLNSEVDNSDVTSMSSMSSMSSMQSVDEGAIAVLSVGQIRDMKQM